jgi:hypothetical protein
LPGDRAVEAHFALALLLEHALVEPANAHEAAMDPEQRRIVEKGIRIGIGGSVIADHAQKAGGGCVGRHGRGARILYGPSTWSMAAAKGRALGFCCEELRVS